MHNWLLAEITGNKQIEKTNNHSDMLRIFQEFFFPGKNCQKMETNFDIFNFVVSSWRHSRDVSGDISGKTNYAPKLLHCLIAEFLVNFYLFFKEFEEGICLDKCCVLWGHFIFISVSTTGKIFSISIKLDYVLCSLL